MFVGCVMGSHDQETGVFVFKKMSCRSEISILPLCAGICLSSGIPIFVKCHLLLVLGSSRGRVSCANQAMYSHTFYS